MSLMKIGKMMLGVLSVATLIANPQLKFLVNEEAEFMISDEQEQNGIFMKVFVPERQTGRAARCSFHIKGNGQTRYLSIFELTLPTD